MKKGYLFLLFVLMLSAAAACLRAEPVITFEFPAGKSVEKSPVGPYGIVRIGEVGTANVIVQGADIMLGGAAFKIDTYGDMLIFNERTVPGVAIGSLFEGIELGLNDPLPQFGAEPAVIASFDFLAFDLMTQTFMITNHPNYTEVQVARSDGVILPASGFVGTAMSVLHPTVGVFFNPEGTIIDGSFNGGAGETVNAWLMVTDTEVPVTAFHLSLDLPDGVGLEGVTLPPDCVMNGDLIGGAVLTFAPELNLSADVTGLLAELVISPGTRIISGGEIRVGGDLRNEMYAPYVDAGGYRFYSCVSLVSTISVPIPNSLRTWADVKALFR